MKTTLGALAAAALAAAAPLLAAHSPTPSDSEIRTILVQRIDAQHQSVGIVVGIVGPAGRRVVAHGRLERGDNRPLDGGTVFEIGSVSKVFTSLLLSDMARRGEVAFADPIQKYLPAQAKVPNRAGREITLEDLATQTSGLPRLPANLNPKDPSDPYADYTVADLYRFLSSFELPRDIGSKYEYSNLGVGLLGHVLSLKAGMTYEALLRSRICEPLGMKSTVITVAPEMRARFAAGHDTELKTVPYWNLPTLAGAGAIRSSADDLLTFLAANLGYVSTPLAPAMASMLDVRRPTGTPGLEIALGWHILTRDGAEIVWHNGGTGGFRSFVGFVPGSRIGVVVLSNAETEKGVDDIGMHLLDAKAPLAEPAVARREAAVDPAISAATSAATSSRRTSS
jgi:D-alanyl-D-alanine-carboxypeptidase/D-alanyl-D-alanine-endopeptidase